MVGYIVLLKESQNFTVRLLVKYMFLNYSRCIINLVERPSTSLVSLKVRNSFRKIHLQSITDLGEVLGHCYFKYFVFYFILTFFNLLILSVEPVKCLDF